MNTILAQDTALESRIEWRNLPESWQVFVFLAGVLALLGYVLWSYLKEIKQLPLWARWTLTGIRCSVIILLIVLYLDPVKTDYREIQRRPTVAVLSDLSQSMSQRDRWTDEPLAQRVAETMKVPLEDVQRGEIQRLDVLKTILLGEEGLAERLRQKAHVRLLTFGRGVDTVTTLPTSSSNDESKLGPSENLEPEPSNDGNDSENRGGLQSLDALASEWKANRSESDLVEALQSSLNINQLQAIYLLTDGQHTAVTQPVEVARRARELGIPIYTVGIGDPSRPKNVAVKSTSVLEKARPNEPFAVDAVLTAQQLKGARIQVDLLRESLDSTGSTVGEALVVESRERIVDDAAWLKRERFTQSVDVPGRYRYRVRIKAIDDELTEDDNVGETSMVEITTEKVKLLLIAGTANWEYRQLQKLYQRDRAISLTCWLQSMAPERPQEGNERIAVLPRTFEQLAQYNAVMMIDPNPDEFDEEWIQNLTRFVEQKAGGLMFVAGQRFTTDFLSLGRTYGIRKLLPVRLEAGGNAALTNLLQTSSGLAGFQPVSANLDHQVLGFSADPGENLQIWKSMPGIYWSYPAIS
ncbi:MAG: vWA domain-containing protein, partial [Planctomycetota bacterium]|nr:vWA domain-containing protein [Planctomycetota bacterium]